jgi:hypothetical protein
VLVAMQQLAALHALAGRPWHHQSDTATYDWLLAFMFG